jgi:import receptor subunit TOM70
MSSETPLPATPTQVVLDTSKLPASSTQSVWDRISNWVSENKAVVYTIAGVAVVVTGAGVVYYLSDSKKPASAASTTPKKSKNQRRKEKKKAEEKEKAKTASVQDGALRDKLSTQCDRGIATDITAEPVKKAEEPTEELPNVDEATVDQLSEEVCYPTH